VIGRTFTRYYPWWIAFGWLLGYEAWAALTHHTTLSRMVWRATVAWPALPFVAVPFIIVLAWHFWGGLWAPRRR
jgi:hypothetical protein